MPPPKKHQTAAAATARTEPVALAPEPTQEVATALAVRETPEKLSAPAFEPSTDTSASYARLVFWYASGAEVGRRSFLATARHYGVDESTVRDQAKKGRWLERAAAFDRQLLARELDTSLAVQRRATVAQIALATRLTTVIERVVTQLEGVDDESVLDTLEPALEAAKALARVQSSLRVAVGLPTGSQRIDVRVEHANAAPDMTQFDGMSEEEVLLMGALQRAKLKRLGHG